MSKQICQLHQSKHHFIQKLRMNEHVFATRARDLSLSYFFSPLFILVTPTEELRKYTVSLRQLPRCLTFACLIKTLEIKTVAMRAVSICGSTQIHNFGAGGPHKNLSVFAEGAVDYLLCPWNLCREQRCV